jgi:hypothetical protein
MTDLKLAVRQLLKNRGFTAGAVLTLTFSIGASTAIFRFAYSILLWPLPFKDPQKLVMLFPSSNACRAHESFAL